MIEIKKQWLAGEVFAGVECKRVSTDGLGRPLRRSFERISLNQEPNAVFHTTEGHWFPSLSVFSNSTGTPTMMCGYETINENNEKVEGPLRLAQFMPLGEMALTLENDSGGTETNREALFQVEVVAFSKFDPWLPDEPVVKVLAALMDRLEEVCGIPLQRAGNGTRSVNRWDGKAGWFGHGEVPENSHTDPRDLEWGKVFAAAPNETDTFWEARAGGELIHAERAEGAGEKDAYDRLINWVDSHEGVIRDAERENGHVRLLSAVRPVRG
jgi:hypothetical protein